MQERLIQEGTLSDPTLGVLYHSEDVAGEHADAVSRARR